MTRIEYQAFANNSSLSGVVFPSSINFIGGYAFSRCDNISSIAFDNVSSLNIEGYAFNVDNNVDKIFFLNYISIPFEN
jgi:hypothetical protein